MGTKKFGPFLSAVAVSFCLGFGAVGCVATGFQLDVASMVTVAAVCLLLALLTGFLSKENVGFFLLVGIRKPCPSKFPSKPPPLQRYMFLIH